MFFVSTIWILFAIPRDVAGTNPFLTPGPTANVTENDRLTLTCVYTANSVTPGSSSFQWRKDGNAFLTPWSSGCSRFIDPPSGYTDTCTKSPDTYIFTMTTPALTRSDDRQTWQCVVDDGSDQLSGVIIVSVLVPITTVHFSPSGHTVAVIADTVKEFVCETDAGRPQASITWYGYTGTSPANAVEIPGGTSTTSPGGAGLMITRGTLRYSPARDLLGWRIFCTASNTGVTKTSQTATLDVQYPPTIHPIPNQRFMKGSSVSVTCTVTPGNPGTTTYTWTRNTSSSWSQSGASLSISSVQKTDAATYTCMATNIMVGGIPGRDTEDFLLNVLFPPSVPTFSVRGTAVSGTVREVRGRDLPVTCISSSNPDPTYTWTSSKLPTEHQGPVLTLTGIQPTMDGQYTCKVTNTMVPTSGGTVQRANQASITLETLFPPVVSQIPGQAIEENKQLHITCPTITPGNPAANFWWRNDKDRWSRPGQTLTLTPSRDDAGRYTCTASNTMQPSQGDPETGTDSKSFNVDVYFKSSNTTFEIKDHPGTNITNSEKENFTFECSATSNPASTITVRKDTKVVDTNVVAQSDNTQKVEYPIDNAKCEDSGTYTCTAYNQYNRGVPATTHAMQLNVRCTPRPKYHTDNNVTVNKVLAESFTLNLTVVAYPRPTNYTWYKLSGSQWVPLNAHGSMEISNETAHGAPNNTFVYTISISRAEQDDFGQYKLEVQNGIGPGLVQFFTVTSHTTPDAPMFVYYKPISTTEVTIKWKPGNNGGLSQTFHLLYKTVNQNKWTEQTAREDTLQNIDGDVKYTLKGLSAGTEYSLKIFSRNGVGDSGTTVFGFFTKDAETHVCPELSCAGIAGGAVAIVLVIFILVGGGIAVFLRRRYDWTLKTHSDIQEADTAVAPPDSTTYEELSPDRQKGADAYEMIQRQDEGKSNPVYSNVAP